MVHTWTSPPPPDRALQVGTEKSGYLDRRDFNREEEDLTRGGDYGFLEVITPVLTHNYCNYFNVPVQIFIWQISSGSLAGSHVIIM